MEYREFKPSARSEHFIQSIWTLEHDGPSAVPQRVVPDGHPELILNLGEPFEAYHAAKWQRQPRCFFTGQIAGPLLLRPRGPAKIVGIRFHPQGAARLCGAPMDELVGRFTPVADLSPTLAANLDRALDSHGCIHLTEAALLSATNAAQPDALAAEAVRRLGLARGDTKLSKLADELGVSVRQFERRFRAAVGLSPKLYCRVQRFANVFRVLGRGSFQWVDVAVDSGYYDQAHLIRDFKELSGETPAVLLAPEADLARHFLTRFGMSHSSNTARTDLL